MRRREVLRATLAAGSGLLLASCAGIAPAVLRPTPREAAAVPVPAASALPPAPALPAVTPGVGSVPPSAAPPTPTPELVPFTGTVQHLMTHPLVAYPSRAFHGPMAQGYNEWFITVTEFDRILPQLYANDYILIDPHLMFTETTVAGQSVLTPRQLMLPKGKKPLIFSFDDMNYYDYMREYGNVFRLILDPDGNIATYSVDPQGNTVISRSNELVPIVDRFVQSHPDFSFHGAKGLLNLTGYQGILGYRTDRTTASDYNYVRSEAENVVARLKATGWRFACHGWGHLDDPAISYNSLVADTQRWLQQVAPLTGPTDVYVYPFGADLLPTDPKFAYLLEHGFHVFFGIGPTPYLRMTRQWMAMDRVQMDGVTLETEPKVLAPFFNAATVLDKAERGL